jgi:hypothetical protein
MLQNFRRKGNDALQARPHDNLLRDMRGKHLASIPASLFRNGANTDFGKPPIVQSDVMFETQENATLSAANMMVDNPRIRRITAQALSRVNYAPQLEKWMQRRSALDADSAPILQQDAPWKTSDNVPGSDEPFDDGGVYGARNQLALYGKASQSRGQNASLFGKRKNVNFAPQNQGVQLSEADLAFLARQEPGGYERDVRKKFNDDLKRRANEDPIGTGLGILGGGYLLFSHPHLAAGLASVAAAMAAYYAAKGWGKGPTEEEIEEHIVETAYNVTFLKQFDMFKDFTTKDNKVRDLNQKELTFLFEKQGATEEKLRLFEAFQQGRYAPTRDPDGGYTGYELKQGQELRSRDDFVGGKKVLEQLVTTERMFEIRLKQEQKKNKEIQRAAREESARLERETEMQKRENKRKLDLANQTNEENIRKQEEARAKDQAEYEAKIKKVESNATLSIEQKEKEVDELEEKHRKQVEETERLQKENKAEQERTEAYYKDREEIIEKGHQEDMKRQQARIKSLQKKLETAQEYHEELAKSEKRLRGYRQEDRDKMNVLDRKAYDLEVQLQGFNERVMNPPMKTRFENNNVPAPQSVFKGPATDTIQKVSTEADPTLPNPTKKAGVETHNHLEPNGSTPDAKAKFVADLASETPRPTPSAQPKMALEKVLSTHGPVTAPPGSYNTTTAQIGGQTGASQASLAAFKGWQEDRKEGVAISFDDERASLRKVLMATQPTYWNAIADNHLLQDFMILEKEYYAYDKGPITIDLFMGDLHERGIVYGDIEAFNKKWGHMEANQSRDVWATIIRTHLKDTQQGIDLNRLDRNFQKAGFFASASNQAHVAWEWAKEKIRPTLEWDAANMEPVHPYGFRRMDFRALNFKQWKANYDKVYGKVAGTGALKGKDDFWKTVSKQAGEYREEKKREEERQRKLREEYDNKPNWEKEGMFF